MSYTGTTSIQTIGHSLGAVPSMMIIKNRNPSATTNWAVYHKNASTTPQNVALNINTTASISTAIGWWNNTMPTNT